MAFAVLVVFSISSCKITLTDRSHLLRGFSSAVLLSDLFDKMYMLAEPDKTQVLRANLVDQLNGWAFARKFASCAVRNYAKKYLKSVIQIFEAEENWLSASKKFTALLLFVGALSIVVMFGLVVSSDAGSNQKELIKKRRCDATQYVTVDVDQMIVKKKFLAVFAENKCARPIQIVACY